MEEEEEARGKEEIKLLLTIKTKIFYKILIDNNYATYNYNKNYINLM